MLCCCASCGVFEGHVRSGWQKMTPAGPQPWPWPLKFSFRVPRGSARVRSFFGYIIEVLSFYKTLVFGSVLVRKIVIPGASVSNGTEPADRLCHDNKSAIYPKHGRPRLTHGLTLNETTAFLHTGLAHAPRAAWSTAAEMLRRDMHHAPRETSHSQCSACSTLAMPTHWMALLIGSSSKGGSSCL